jgi:hypothetical protein
MAKSPLLIASALLILFSGAGFCDSVLDSSDELIDHYETQERQREEYSDFYQPEAGTPWSFVLALNGGYNQLLKGYKGYENLGNAGLDLYVRPSRSYLEDPGWKDRLIFRLSVDYFPLQVPEGVYGITEDIYGLHGAIMVRFHRLSFPETRQWVPFTGVGLGTYFDQVTLDTPATGKVSGIHRSLGANASIGLFSPRMGSRWQIIPEIRFHILKIPDAAWSMNMTYQVGLAYWFSAHE